MGWCQTGKLNFWRNGSYDEFMGLSEGYLCVINDRKDRIALRVLFLSENKERAKEIKTMFRRDRDLLPKGGITIRDNVITLIFGSFLFFFRNKVERAKATLPAITSWLRSKSIRPSVVCACGRQDRLKCVMEGDGAVHIRCPECAANVQSPITATPANTRASAA